MENIDYYYYLGALVLIVIIYKIYNRAKKRKIKRNQEIFKAAKKRHEERQKVILNRKIEVDKKDKVSNLKNTASKDQTTKPRKSAKQTKKKIDVDIHREELKEPEIKYETKKEKLVHHKKTASKTKNKEILPEAKSINTPELTENLFVDYDLSLSRKLDVFPVIRIPKKGCIVRSHRFGNTKRRGFKEISFQKSIEKYFNSHFLVSGEVRLNTGVDTRPFEPDIALIEKGKNKNIRFDIEIDEPYAGITRQPTHCKNEDTLRDTYFVDRGWIVLRFSEHQVHTKELECLKFIARLANKLDPNFTIPADLAAVPDLISEKIWDMVQAQQWEKARYREKYLNHEFGEILTDEETPERGFSEQEVNEEKLVQTSMLATVENIKSIGFNKSNFHPRDTRISFYPEEHVYTIDQVPVPSASTVIGKFFPQFDAYGKATTLSPSNPLFGLDADEIVEIWNKRGADAANLGTVLHEQIENYYLKQPVTETDEFILFKEFVKDHPNISPYRTEWRIFDDHYNIAGTIDLISKNGGNFEIYDWKRSKKVVDPSSGNPIKHDTWGNTGVGKLSSIEDTSYNKYCLQQSLYCYILEKNYDLEVDKMFLVVLYPEYDSYHKVETPYWKDKVEYILNTL
ncbi:hypothetical protein [uncultured Marivirga sp.]|uniref:hypothetical protein n=1 Tax=uncultured Marivirga sp. TaxID=1123707 RepID=UPI0030EB5DEB|tara:strand:+ start:23590 stop:25467 length:1878 start_codon:yes stop_codon:yes gene_type:complete